MFDEVIKVVKELVKAINENTAAIKVLEFATTDASRNVIFLNKDILELIKLMGEK